MKIILDTGHTELTQDLTVRILEDIAEILRSPEIGDAGELMDGSYQFDTRDGVIFFNLED